MEYIVRIVIGLVIAFICNGLLLHNISDFHLGWVCGTLFLSAMVCPNPFKK